jgi:hypothetical protein
MSKTNPKATKRKKIHKTRGTTTGVALAPHVRVLVTNVQDT